MSTPGCVPTPKEDAMPNDERKTKIHVSAVQVPQPIFYGTENGELPVSNQFARNTNDPVSRLCFVSLIVR
jgi:hypothetical protein